jgi:hypothetical protein
VLRSIVPQSQVVVNMGAKPVLEALRDVSDFGRKSIGYTKCKKLNCGVGSLSAKLGAKDFVGLLSVDH